MAKREDMERLAALVWPARESAARLATLMELVSGNDRGGDAVEALLLVLTGQEDLRALRAERDRLLGIIGFP